MGLIAVITAVFALLAAPALAANVGFEEIKIANGTEALLTIGVWYPTDAPETEHRLSRRRARESLFLNVGIARSSCAGCRGRALIREKLSCLRMRPRLTSHRSTPKRSPRTRLRSTHRQRTTPSLSGSGPVSTISRNSSFCSADSFGTYQIGN